MNEGTQLTPFSKFCGQTELWAEGGKALFQALSAQQYLALAHPSGMEKLSVGLNFGHILAPL